MESLMNANEQLINKFYSSFQQKNWRGMQECYDEENVFGDPVFQNLRGKETYAMWHMLIMAGKDLRISFKNINANETSGSCQWEAYYSFSRTGRKVHNIIRAEFKFRHGKIAEHRDTFDFWRWSRMALGVPGALLGWSPIIRKKVVSTARQSLIKFIDEHPEYKS